MTTEEKIKYASWLSRVGLLRMGAIRQSCVAAAKITTEVLRSLGVQARPITASVLVATDGWLKAMEENGGPPKSPDELKGWWDTHRAYSLGVMYDPIPQAGAWNAHMIVLAGPGQSYLVDPSIDQLSHPQRDLPLEPLVFDMSGQDVFSQLEFRRGRTQAVSHWSPDEAGQGFIIVHSVFPADRSFRKLNDFRMFEHRYGDMARSIAQTIQRMDELKLTGHTLPPLPPLPDAPDDPSLRAQDRTPEYLSRLRQTADG